MTAPPGDAWEDLGGQAPPAEPEPAPAPAPTAPAEPPAEGQHRNVCVHCGTAIEYRPPTNALKDSGHNWRHVGTLFYGCLPASLGLWAEPSS